MINLCRTYDEWQDKPGDWDSHQVDRVLQLMRREIPNLEVDWEIGDENWARVLQAGLVAALVSAELPIMILNQNLEPLKDRIQSEIPLLALVLAKFEEPVFEDRREDLEELFARSLSENVSYGELSVDDLWWLTVH